MFGVILAVVVLIISLVWENVSSEKESESTHLRCSHLWSSNLWSLPKTILKRDFFKTALGKFPKRPWPLGIAQVFTFSPFQNVHQEKHWDKSIPPPASPGRGLFCQKRWNHFPHCPLSWWWECLNLASQYNWTGINCLPRVGSHYNIWCAEELGWRESVFEKPKNGPFWRSVISGARLCKCFSTRAGWVRKSDPEQVSLVFWYHWYQ